MLIIQVEKLKEIKDIKKSNIISINFLYEERRSKKYFIYLDIKDINIYFIGYLTLKGAANFFSNQKPRIIGTNPIRKRYLLPKIVKNRNKQIEHKA